MHPSFVHLRLHSEYSIADGIVRIPDAVSAAKADSMPALALTDLSNVFGLVKFYKEARGAGVKPIVGCDVFVSNDVAREQPFRLLLLCQSHAGYLRLCELLTRAYLHNQNRGRPEIRRQWLQEGTDGLIALSGAHLGEVGATLANGNASSARAIAQEYAGLFLNRFYLEVQRYGAPREEGLLRDTVKLAAELALPVVATHPVQFISIDDFKAHEARVCIAEGYVLNDKRRQRVFTAQQYFKTQAEMVALFADLPEALQNSVEIAKRCNISLRLGKNFLPDFPTPNGESLDDFLRSESQRGLVERMLYLYPDEAKRTDKWTEYQDRLDFEIETIIKMGFPGYFLIVADFIRWAKLFRDEKFPNGVPVGPGRGSGAGSLVAYSLGITDLDPLRYDLLFERFLNPERVSMPDFDVDFCQDGRERVIEYVRHKYGVNNVSQIATFGTMASKGVIRDVGRVLDFPYMLCDRLSKLVPLDGVKPVSLAKAREMEPEFNAIIASEEGVDELMELGASLEDLTRNVGMHAGGVLIAPGKLTDFCPLYCAEGSESTVSQYDKDDVEAVGLVKFDFLGLRTLTILDWALRYVRALEKGGAAAQLEKGEGGRGKGNGGAEGFSPSPLSAEGALPSPFPSRETASLFTLEGIPLDDKPTYDKIFRTANTTAVFQFESRGMKDSLVKAQPDCIDDLIALNALYRPGPMDFIPDYINRKHKREQVVIPHPCLEKVVGATYGIMVYQEQVMQAAQVVAGYTLGGADMLRRAMGKKKAEEMAEQRSIFVTGAANNNIDEKKANEIFDTMEKFAGYGFNKSHAAAYSVVAYQTAYLKCHYPAAFMASTLTSEMVNTDKISFFYQDTLQQGVNILPPDINSSFFRFTPVDEKTIAYGLGAVKGTGEAAVENIVAARRDGAFKNLFDFCRRVDKRIVNRRSIEALIRAGAFDSICDHRAQLLASLDSAMDSAEQHARHANQNSLFGDDDSADMPLQMADVPRWKMREQLTQEKTALGFFLSGHPINEFAAELSNFVKYKLVEVTPELVAPPVGNNGFVKRNSGKQLVLAGMVNGVRILQTRRGKMAVVTLDDGTAQVEVTVFADLYDANRPWIRDDELLVVQGRASLDDYSGGMRVTADEVFDYAGARATFAKRLDIFCAIDGPVRVPQLAEQLKPYLGGRCPVQLNYRNLIGSAPLRLGEEWQVTLPDELLEGLRELCGADNVKVVYG